MSNCFDHQCPKCGSTDQIDVLAHVWVRLTDDGTDADASGDGGHFFDDTHAATCGQCGYAGKLGEFDAEKGGAR